MMRALYTSASGMMTQQLNMDTISNNLANVNTTGFKKSRVEFQDLLYQHIKLAGSIDALGQQIPVGIEVGNGARPSATQKIFTQGEISQTDNPLDLMIKGDGFFQIAMPDGSLAYSRDGSFKMDATGRIVTSDGHPLEPAVTIPSQAEQIVVREDGQVEITLPNGQGNQIIGHIQTAKFLNNAGLTSEGSNLYRTTDASGEPMVGQPGIEGFGTLSQGMLEVSNVKTIEEMVALITTQRAYEVNTKAIQAADDMLNLANNLRR